MVCYKEGHFTYEDSLQQPRKIAKMQALRSGHIAIDLASDRSTHVEESCQLVEGPPTIFPMRPSVMMMSRQPDLSDRLQILAQRLQELQSRREPRSHGEQEQEFSQEGASSSRGRPETTGVSLLGQAQSRPCEGQSVCQLEQLQPMRVEIDLHCQGQHGGQLPSDGSRTSGDSHCHGGVEDNNGGERDHRADSEWKADGGQGQTPPDGLVKGTNVNIEYQEYLHRLEHHGLQTNMTPVPKVRGAPQGSQTSGYQQDEAMVVNALETENAILRQSLEEANQARARAEEKIKKEKTSPRPKESQEAVVVISETEEEVESSQKAKKKTATTPKGEGN